MDKKIIESPEWMMGRPLKEAFTDLKWPEDRPRLKDIQVTLAARTRIVPLAKKPRFIAGVDAAFLDDRVIAAACLYRYPSLELVEERSAVKEVTFPYIPGLLSFREGPAVMEALSALNLTPDLIIFDGQGIAHPRGLGLASCVGVLLDIPSVGCAKSRLVGEFTEPGRKKGARSALRYRGKLVGAVVRTRDDKKPVFVSPGHRIDVPGAVQVVLGCVKKFRITEPVRCADRLAGEIKRSLIHNG